MAAPKIEHLRKAWGRKVAAAAASDPSAPVPSKAFDALEPFDPTGRGSYLDWVCRRYCEGAFRIEDAARVAATLTLFHLWKRRLPLADRDLGRLADEQAVWALVERFAPKDDGEPADAQGREARRRDRALALSQSEILHDGDGWLLAAPLTRAAAVWWGRGTRWCTSMANANHFETYSSKGQLVVFVDPEGEKFQGHPATSSWAKADDRAMKPDGLLSRLPAGALAALMRVCDGVAEGPEPIRWYALPEILRSPGASAMLEARAVTELATIGEDGGWRVSKPTTALAQAFVTGKADSSAHWHHQARGVRPGVFRVDSPSGSRTLSVMDAKADRAVAVVTEALDGAPHAVLVATVAAALTDAPPGADHWKALARVLHHDEIPNEVWLRAIRSAGKKAISRVDPGIPEGALRGAVLEALVESGRLDLVPHSLRTRETVVRCLRKQPHLITEVDDADIDEEMALLATSGRDGFSPIPARFLSRSFLEAAVERWPGALAAVPVRERTYAMCLSAASRNGQMIKHVPPEHMSRELLVKSMSNDGTHLPMIPEDRRDAVLCMLAIASCPDMVVHSTVPMPRHVFLAAVSRCPTILAKVPLEYRDDEMCAAAVKDPAAWSHMPPAVAARVAAAHPGITHRQSLSRRYGPEHPIRDADPRVEDAPEAMLALSDRHPSRATMGMAA